MNVMKTISDEAKEVLQLIEDSHHEAYFVGGCVRDALRGKEIKDIDIATSATPEQIMKIFTTVIPVGVEHGTVIVRYKGESYEITTFRHEANYSDKRHPDNVTFITDIREDLARRDFTINAMAMNRQGILIDPFHGQLDLDKGIIQTVGSPKERFLEDSLRIIRALRFSSQLGFSIDEQTLHQMFQLKQQLENVSIERITTEMTKFFQGLDIKIGYKYLLDTGIANYLPIFKEDPELIYKLPNITTSFDSFAEVAALFHLQNERYSIDEWMKAWKCSNKEKRYCKQLVKAIHYMTQNQLDNWLLYQLEIREIEAFIRILSYVSPTIQLEKEELLERKKALPLASRDELCVNGSDVKKLFPTFRKGAWIGKMLEEIEYQIVMGMLKNKKNEIKEWILCHPPERD